MNFHNIDSFFVKDSASLSTSLNYVVNQNFRKSVKMVLLKDSLTLGPLHDPVTWYQIKYTGEQVTQCDFQINAPAFVLEVPLRNLLTSIFNLAPCDRVVQRAYYQDIYLARRKLVKSISGQKIQVQRKTLYNFFYQLFVACS